MMVENRMLVGNSHGNTWAPARTDVDTVFAIQLLDCRI
jgi:hypothetical protein